MTTNVREITSTQSDRLDAALSALTDCYAYTNGAVEAIDVFVEAARAALLDDHASALQRVDTLLSEIGLKAELLANDGADAVANQGAKPDDSPAYLERRRRLAERSLGARKASSGHLAAGG